MKVPGPTKTLHTLDVEVALITVYEGGEYVYLWEMYGLILDAR